MLAVMVTGPVLAAALAPMAAQAAPVASLPSGTVYVTSLDLNAVHAINPFNHTINVISGAGRMNGPVGIAITPNGHTAYVTNSLGDTVTPIDLTTSPPRPGLQIKVGNGPSAIAITPNGRTAYVSNFNVNTVTPIDLTTNPARPGTPIKVGNGPWSIAISANGRFVCVSNSEDTTASVIDTVTRKVTVIQLGNRPQAVAAAPNGKTFYVANGNQVTPIQLSSGVPSLGSPINVPNGPLGIAVTPNGSYAYTANVDNTLTAINLKTHPATAAAAIAVAGLTQPDGIAISPNGAIAYVANASNTVTPINLKTNPLTPQAPFQVGNATFGIAIAPGQAPIARLKVITKFALKATIFNAQGSRVPGGTIARYHWIFGDGHHKNTLKARTTHVYKHPGFYHAVLIITSADATSTRSTFTGQTVSNNGGRTAMAKWTVSIAALLQTHPGSGPPGQAVTLHDEAFTNPCRPVYVFFDNKLVAETRPKGHVIDLSKLVIPGDATLGHHELALSCTTSRPWVLSASFDVVYAKNHLSEFSIAMPNWKELRKHLLAAGGISLLMLILSRIIAAGFPTDWLNATYIHNRHRFGNRLRKRFPRLLIDRDAPRSLPRRMLGGIGLFTGFVACAGLINSLLDRSFGWNRTTLWLFLGQSIGVALLTMSTEVPVAIAGVLRKRKVHLHVLVGGMMIAVVCVAAARALGLAPGYSYGLIAMYVWQPETDEKDWGRIHAISALCVMVAATLAFFITQLVFGAATSADPSPFLLVLVPALNVLFLAGFASLAFGMFPLPFLPGRHIAQWSKVAWFAIGSVGLVGFIAVLLSPGGGSPGEVHHIALIPMVVAFVTFALVSLGFMLYFHLKSREDSEHESEHESQTESSGEVE
jgi:DNA-binding beta-propeller fold protein YncE